MQSCCVFNINWKPLRDYLDRYNIGIIGHQFGRPGLRDVDFLAYGSVDAILQGCHYNKGVRAHKLEAFNWLSLSAFRQWDNEPASPLDILALANVVDDIWESAGSENIKYTTHLRYLTLM